MLAPHYFSGSSCGWLKRVIVIGDRGRVPAGCSVVWSSPNDPHYRTCILTRDRKLNLIVTFPSKMGDWVSQELRSHVAWDIHTREDEDALEALHMVLCTTLNPIWLWAPPQSGLGGGCRPRSCEMPRRTLARLQPFSGKADGTVELSYLGRALALQHALLDISFFFFFFSLDFSLMMIWFGVRSTYNIQSTSDVHWLLNMYSYGV